MARNKQEKGKGKRQSKANGNGKHRNGNGHATKKTAEQLSDEQRMSLLFNHLGKIKPLIEAKKEAESDLKAAYDLAKAEGVTKKEIELAIKFESEEGAQSIESDLERIARIARWSGAKLGTQFNLFDAKGEKIDPIFEEGKRAALKDPAGKPKPPAHHHPKAAQRWLAGFHEGRSILNEQRTRDFGKTELGGTTLGEAAAGVVANLGTEQATHVQG